MSPSDSKKTNGSSNSSTQDVYMNNKGLPVKPYKEDKFIQEFSEGPKTRRTRARVDSKANPIKDKKKRRLEQNRISARESRKKKKKYISSLETEIKALREKIKDLEKEKFSEAMMMNDYQPIYCTCGVHELREKIDNSIQMVFEAFNEHNTSLVNSQLEKLRRQYIEEAVEVKRVEEGLFNTLVQCIIPKSFARLLWMAKNEKDVFDNSYFVDCEESKSELFTPIDKEVTCALKLEEEQKIIISNMKKKLKVYADKFIKSFADIRNKIKEIFKEVKYLDSAINEELTRKLDIEVIVKYLQWIMRNPTKINFYHHLREEPEGIYMSQDMEGFQGK